MTFNRLVPPSPDSISLIGIRSIVLLVIASCMGCQLPQWVANGFKVGPNYARPTAMIADQWIETQDEQFDASQPEDTDWWLAFDDRRLNELIRAAYEQNFTLREAGLRVMQARARRAITVGELFPQSQSAFGGFERIQESQNIAVPPSIRIFDEWITGAQLAWELDVWGRFRRAILAADADVEVAIGDYDAVLLCLIADVAIAYAEYRTFEQRLLYARRNVELQEGSLQLTEERADAGSTGFTSVHLARSSLESTRAAIPNLEIGLRQAGNQLCTLLGIPTQDLKSLIGEGNIPEPPRQVAIGIPADLLRRRPDIRAAERQVASQSEQIGIARSDLYPHFVLSGEYTVSSEDFDRLFSSGSTGGLFNPSFQWDLLNYGRIINNVELQGLGLEALIASYRNTVLTANQEVEDALVAYSKTLERLRYLEITERETREALRLLIISFEEGEIDFTGVFVMQTELVRQQDQVAQARGDIITSLVRLFKALGGGWQVRCRGFQDVAYGELERLPDADPDDDDPLLQPPVPSQLQEELPSPQMSYDEEPST